TYRVQWDHSAVALCTIIWCTAEVGAVSIAAGPRSRERTGERMAHAAAKSGADVSSRAALVVGGVPYVFAGAASVERGRRKRVRQGWSAAGRLPVPRPSRSRATVRRAVARSGLGDGGAVGGATGRRAAWRACRATALSASHWAQICAQPSAQRSLQARARNATIGFTFRRAPCLPLPFHRAS